MARRSPEKFRLKFGDNVVAAARPDGGTRFQRVQRRDEIGQRRDHFGQPCHVFADLLRHVRVTRADGLEPQLAAEAQRHLIVLKRGAAVEDLHTVQTLSLIHI